MYPKLCPELQLKPFKNNLSVTKLLEPKLLVFLLQPPEQLELVAQITTPEFFSYSFFQCL